MGYSRRGCDGVVLGDKPFACQRVSDDVSNQDSSSCISNRARHRKSVGYIKPEDVQTFEEFIVQFLAAWGILIEKHGISIRVEE